MINSKNCVGFSSGQRTILKHICHKFWEVTLVAYRMLPLTPFLSDIKGYLRQNSFKFGKYGEKTMQKTLINLFRKFGVCLDIPSDSKYFFVLWWSNFPFQAYKTEKSLVCRHLNRLPSTVCHIRSKTLRNPSMKF